MAIYFKFSSWNHNNFDSVPVESNSPFISIGELKQLIAKKKKLDRNTGLLITNAQTNEEYKLETDIIQRNSSVIVKLVPNYNQAPMRSNAPPMTSSFHHHANNNTHYPSSSTSSSQPITTFRRDDDEFGPSILNGGGASSLLGSSSNNNNKSLSEEDKILQLVEKASNYQVNHVGGGGMGGMGGGYARPPTTVAPAGVFRGPNPSGAVPSATSGANMHGGAGGGMGGPRKIPPPGYMCHRCGQGGHFIYDCPTNGDPSYNVKKRPPPTWHGVPKAFLQDVNGKGPQFKPNESEFEKIITATGLSKEAPKPGTIPKELICPLCHKILQTAVLVPCCMESTCDECIRSALMEEKNNFHCPMCSSAVVPDALLPNKALRRAVENFLSSGQMDGTEADGSNPNVSPIASSANSPTRHTREGLPTSSSSSSLANDHNDSHNNNNNSSREIHSETSNDSDVSSHRRRGGNHSNYHGGGGRRGGASRGGSGQPYSRAEYVKMLSEYYNLPPDYDYDMLQRYLAEQGYDVPPFEEQDYRDDRHHDHHQRYHHDERDREDRRRREDSRDRDIERKRRRDEEDRGRRERSREKDRESSSSHHTSSSSREKGREREDRDRRERDRYKDSRERDSSYSSKEKESSSKSSSSHYRERKRSRSRSRERVSSSKSRH